jgi:putative ABC transport system permease protein
MPVDVLRQIWAEGLLVSLLGGAVGLLLGLAGAWGLAQWRGLPFALEPLVWTVPLALVLVASLAGLFPARAAARLDPSVALRGPV